MGSRPAPLRPEASAAVQRMDPYVRFRLFSSAAVQDVDRYGRHRRREGQGHVAEGARHGGAEGGHFRPTETGAMGKGWYVPEGAKARPAGG